MTTHELKIKPEYFQPIWTDIKRFEVRYNDRDYKVGDKLIMNEYDEKFTNRFIEATITYILRDFAGLGNNWVVLGIQWTKKRM